MSESLRVHSVSRGELDALYLTDRVKPEALVDLIGLPPEDNVYDHIDIGLTPYLLEPLKTIGDQTKDWVFLIAPTQSGKTVFLQCVVADKIVQDPSPLIYILPDKINGERQFKSKIIKMIDHSPAMSKYKTEKVRDIKSTGVALQHMTIHLSWAGSLGALSSTTAKTVILDEVRLMPLEIRNESNAIRLANDRLTTYAYHGAGQGFGVSSCSVEKDLLWQQMKIHGTIVLYWYVPCPECGEYQKLDFFKNVKYNKTTHEVKCKCVFCKGEFKDHDMKRSWNAKGVYATDKCVISKDGSVRQAYKWDYNRRVVFRYNSLASPFRGFKKIWDEYIETKDKMENYKNFVQCWLAEFWVNDKSKVTTASMQDSKDKHLVMRVVPEETQLLTLGIDSQDDGFYVAVRAWRTNGRTHLVDAFFISSNMHTDKDEDIYEKLNELFTIEYVGVKGEKWKIATGCIDTGGHRTKQVYRSTSMIDRLTWVKGRDTQQEPIALSKTAGLFLVRTGEYLAETEFKAMMPSFTLPADVSNDYINQFINVRRVEETNKKTHAVKVYWKKVGQCDYRYADIHNFITLDITIADLGTLRRRIQDPKFVYNPFTIEQNRIAKKVVREEETGEFVGANNDWDINTGKGDWL